MISCTAQYGYLMRDRCASEGGPPTRQGRRRRGTRRRRAGGPARTAAVCWRACWRVRGGVAGACVLYPVIMHVIEDTRDIYIYARIDARAERRRA
jgi:hypothetical protein